MSEAVESRVSNEGMLLSGLEKSLMDYLRQNQGDRYLTVSRLSLALGSNELLVKRSLKILIGYHLVTERENDAGDVTYRASENPHSEEASQTPKAVTLEQTVTEKLVEEKKEHPKGISEAYWCGEPGCKRWFDTLVGRANHRRFVHGIHESNIKRHRSQKSIKIDEQIKKLYPEKTPAEIADILKLSYPSVGARINKMHMTGEIKGYSGQKKVAEKKSESCPQETIEPAVEKIAPQKPQHSVMTQTPITANSNGVEVQSSASPFNIGQLLKVSSGNQVAVVNATLEVIDERGSQYEVSITRIGKGVNGRGPIPLEFSKEVWSDLDDALDYHSDYLRDVTENEEFKEDDLDLHNRLVRQLESVKIIRSKIQRDVGMPEEKEGKDAPKDT